MKTNPIAPPTYAERLQEQLTRLEGELLAVVEASTVHNIDPNRGSDYVTFIGYPT